AIGSWTYQAKDWVQSFDFLKEAQERGLPVTDLLTHRYPLDKMNEAMEMNISMKGLKIAFVPEA
ncbi:MAG: theronine dehydrogenase, partial [Kiritimatiellae bacterium]|nr:theronine dehydrogenase [Kiritimatiellia bacterium]